ncbi:tripartite ATP-independent periplasmic transporter solute receptor, DctP family [Rhizobium leguminosarum bv. trifolii WSM2297]|uniref:Tripartite ATP-independent periplasmic transporter solute receptor, DctP family n=1 Tax=Rhizobium leguminosarum bv. trifolii WSM2297 TaxID=754762 RepID=J0CN79_RHILT|nr:TRAP transporter substrate-binding protein DctP [Rhizobium leguminosarum]EJC81065.1 tripartite ATP-independent periplasmic transporter solute receptor, DctP family [Rhizobium leguminosarum bv. trifolii WSM2297]
MKRINLTALVSTALIAASLAAPASAEIGRHTFKISNGAAEDHPVSAGVKGMSACLEAKTDGKMKLRGFYNGELGDDAEATQSVRSGSIEMVVTGAAAIGGIEPAMSAFELPFLFTSDAEVDAVMTGPYFDHVAAKMPAHDLILLSIWENGFRNATNAKHPITTIEDFKGLNFRVMQNPIFLDTFRRLGANPVPMAFGEVFTALETGAVDGQENPLPLIQASRFYEVQKYLTLTRHAYSPTPVLISKTVWEGLNPEEQDLLKTCAADGRVKQIERSRAAVNEAVTKLKEEGMEVSELSPDEMGKLPELVAPVYQSAMQTVGQENFDLLSAELKKLRGK